MKKAGIIIYWVSTLWLALGMTSTAIVQILKLKDKAPFMQNLGYPEYLFTILGVWKLLGVVAILMPKFPLLKEWTYAGFFFLMTGAVISHAATNSLSEVFPSLLLLALTLISYFTRPAYRRLVLTN